MNLYAPKYYKEFVCIADKCRGKEVEINSNF